jgi:hypothetical protein
MKITDFSELWRAVNKVKIDIIAKTEITLLGGFFQKRKKIFLFRLFFSYNSTAIPERTILKIINQNFIRINLSAMLKVRQL